ncbi:signal peptide peptidase-domain-containing protein [Phanerochaete sordida]|uniref:Signal peptide peptidase-domain-containing protein n=1 Tax=Phanerochaete sordida TaxID=48140 RepID=A0A9P3LHS3_9APHY|nr:signal peptide peptidase-domain-containing protein [Phanerochaete sordida]
MDAADWDLLSSYAGLLALAVFSIYTGSYGSLPAPKGKGKDGKKQDAEDDEDELPERLSSEDAWLFPVIGSVLLFGLYVIVKYFGREWINWVLQWYFTVAGVGSGSKALISLVRWLVGPTRWRQYETVKISVSRGSKDLLAWSLRTPSLYMIPFGALPSLIYTFGPSESRKSALLTDVLALSFSYNALCFLTLDSFKTGCILLSGLFLYDVWWVFGTEVMVKVATNLDVPIKLLWPKSLAFATDRGFTMLGLGDIVVPGMFVALALRYDQHRAAARGQHATFAKPYFYAALGAYVAGLGATMTVMHVFKAAQPALLYLSPACILSFITTALVRGEFKDAWTWNDQAEESEARSRRPSAASTPHEMSRANSSASANGVTLTSAGRRAEKAEAS